MSGSGMNASGQTAISSMWDMLNHQFNIPK